MTALGDKLRVLVPDVALRDYPALLSTETEGRSWARQGAPEGALVVADYQASPRDRVGFEWNVPAEGICFSLIVRPRMLGHEEGRIYLSATMALAEGDDRIYWPDRILRNGAEMAAVSVYSEIDLLHISWAVVTVLIRDGGLRPAQVVATCASRIREHLDLPPHELAASSQIRSELLGRAVTAYLLPAGPGGKVLSGIAAEINRNGGLVVRDGTRTYVMAPDGVARLELG